MKRSLIVLVTFALVLSACATMAPGTPGVVTQVEGNSVTIAAAGGQSTTYTLGNATAIYTPDGGSAQRSFLSQGQRVLVWANGTNAVRINIEP
jgi:hypothetical protein